MSFYLQVKNINGSVTTKGHEQWIKLNSFDFDTQRNIFVKPGHVSDRECGIPNITDFIITKEVDKASPYLFEASLTGVSLGAAFIDVCGSSDDSNKYLQYVLSDVIISRYNINGIDNDKVIEKPLETLHLNFTKIETKYIPRNSDNKPLSPIGAGYNIETATKI